MLLASLAIAPFLALAVQQQPGIVTIGSWNIEWLGTPDRRRVGLRSEADLDAIAAVLADHADIEVAVLTEINLESEQWRGLRQRLADRGYQFVHGTVQRQTIVIAYDADEVTYLEAGRVEPAHALEYRGDDPARGTCVAGVKRPVIASFAAGNFDFTLVAVHLKSGRNPDGCQDEQFTSWVRGRQMATIQEELRARWSAGLADRDVLIVGDFNGGFTDGGAVVARDGGFRYLTEPANRSAASGMLSYRKGRWESALDHIAIRPATDREWLAGSTMYFPRLLQFTEAELAAYLDHYSDHSLVWAEFRTDLADDD